MAVDIATIGIKVTSDGIPQASDRLKTLTNEGGKAESQNNKLSSSFEGVAKYVTIAAAAMVAWKIADYIKDATLAAARYETLGVVMRVVGNNAGYTFSQMEDGAKKLQKLGIAMMESRQLMITMTTARMDLTKAEQLADLARNTAVIGGINTSEALTRIVRGIQSGEQETLKTIGINVQWDAGYRALAATLGKTTAELSESEKVLARQNTVLGELPKSAGAYEAAMGTAGKAMTSLKRYSDDLKIALGEAFVPALKVMVDDFTEALKTSSKWMKDNKQTLQWWGGAIKDEVHAVENWSRRLVIAYDLVAIALARVWQGSQQIARLSGNKWSEQEVKNAQAYIIELSDEIRAKTKLNEDLIKSRNAVLGNSQSSNVDGTIITPKPATTTISPAAAEKAAKALENWRKTYADLRTSINDLNPAMDEHAKKVSELENKYTDLMNKKGADVSLLKQMRTEHLKAIDDQFKMSEAIKGTSEYFKEYLRLAESEPLQNNNAGEMSLRWAEELKMLDSLGFEAINEQVKTLETMLQDMPELADKVAAAIKNIKLPGDTARSDLSASMGEMLKQANGDTYGAESDRIHREWLDRLAQIEKQYGEETSLQAAKYAAMQRNDELYAAQKKALDIETGKVALASLGDSLSSLGATLMAGNKDQFEKGKQMAIAGATVQMMLGAVNAYTAMSSIPFVGPALGALAAAAAIAAGTQNIAMISSQQYEAREMGGPVTAGQPYIVGEKRAEVFVPNQSGRIIPNTGESQPVSVTQVYQISTGVAETVRSEIGRMVPALTQHAVNAVRSAMRQGQFQGV